MGWKRWLEGIFGFILSYKSRRVGILIIRLILSFFVDCYDLDDKTHVLPQPHLFPVKSKH